MAKSFFDVCGFRGSRTGGLAKIIFYESGLESRSGRSIVPSPPFGVSMYNPLGMNMDYNDRPISYVI